MAEEKDSVQKFYESLHNALMDELSKQDNRCDKRFERGLSTHMVDGICYGLEKALRVLESVKTQFDNQDT